MKAHEHKYELPMLSQAERDRRWARMRQEMSRVGVDCLVAHEGGTNVSALYLTQIDMDGLAIFPLDHDPIFLLPSGERWLHWVTDSQTWVEDVRPVRDLAAAGDALEAIGAKRIGLVDFNGLGRGTYSELSNALSDYETRDASELVYSLRLVKSDEEIAMMERAATAAADAIETLRTTARPGIREHELHAEVYKTLLANGCEPGSALSLEASPKPFHPVRKPSARVLQDGDIIMAHMNPRYAGYFGHPHVTLSLGEPPQEIRAMFDVCTEAFEAFKSNARPGVSFGEASRPALELIEQAGYDWAKEPLAHSIGLNQQERPVSGVLPNPYPDFELVENQTFGLHPWVGRMADGIGIDGGRPVRITKAGAVPFGPTPKLELLVV